MNSYVLLTAAVSTAVPLFILRSGRNSNASTYAIAFLLSFFILFIVIAMMQPAPSAPGGGIGGPIGGWTDVSDTPEGKSVLKNAASKGKVLYNAGAKGAYKFVPSDGSKEILYSKVTDTEAVRA
jgi:hypothetical protein